MSWDLYIMFSNRSCYLNILLFQASTFKLLGLSKTNLEQKESKRAVKHVYRESRKGKV